MESKNKPSVVVKLCGVQGCCPTVELLDGGNVHLRDDHGGLVKLTKNEWNELCSKVRTGELTP